VLRSSSDETDSERIIPKKPALLNCEGSENDKGMD
jgi:hypothetical protein